MEQSPAREPQTLADIPVAILAGGLGTRIRSVIADRPKILAPVGDRPFLDSLLDWLESQGARRVILLLGHLADQVLDYLKTRPTGRLEIETIIEPEPLGTGGAIAFARDRLPDGAVILNGDTFLDLDLAAFAAAALASPTPAAIVVSRQDDTGRYGRVELDGDRLVSFQEKTPGQPGWINAGVYLLKAPALEQLARRQKSSIEKDYFEGLAPRALMAWRTAGRFIDIGTPDSLAEAPEVVLGTAQGSSSARSGTSGRFC